MQYIMIEITNRNFTIAHKIVGCDDRYGFIASCRNRSQAERLVELLNKGDEYETS